MAEAKTEAPILIAWIKGEVVTKHFPAVWATFGAMAMVLAVVVEITVGSAVGLAAVGAIWTGFNLLCIIGVLRGTRTDYLVYRVVPDQRD